MDEGLIIQSAQGLLETGKASLPVAPGVYEPAWYITTGFPLTLPFMEIFFWFMWTWLVESHGSTCQFARQYVCNRTQKVGVI